MKSDKNVPLKMATTTLWNLYAIGFKGDRDLVEVLSHSVAKNHAQLSMTDVVTCYKAFAFQGFLPVDAGSALLKTAIKNVGEYDFAALGDICQSMVTINKTQGDLPLKTFFEIVGNRVKGFEQRDEIDKLIYRASSAFDEDTTVVSQMQNMVLQRDHLTRIKGKNLLLPRQAAQLLSSFAHF